ncbi:MAG TPA: helix-turn-helix domain-containing protein [Pseudomonas sp.]|uniref:helix-turn-helix domain-containing protein n=1 Tax=Pseudomonas sp. TaxID=306 RepID=UPI002B45AF97|nr:helix-turn-helix domain-containing protein [Pseudomonas sp.]HKS15012.1 helix-turn-helix domain-containing protein [Pseudomonas sp.]
MTAGKVLMELLHNPREALGLSRQTGTILADWLEEALLSASNQKAGEIHDAIMEAFQSALAQCSDEAKKVILSNSKADFLLKEVYQIGQLNLAQLLAAQSLDRRVSSEFTEALTDRAHESYLKALLEAPKTNKELSITVGQAEETVSRKLKRLRELGIVYSKKVGTAVINSITAPGKQSLEELGMLQAFETEQRNKSRAAVNHAFESIKLSASPYMQDQPGFSRTERAFGW